jgi:GT2 family glycosyltransferase/SAM-dependent methyltransferase
MRHAEHDLAHRLLDGLRGLEIGAAAHNPFGLNTRNVAPRDDHEFYAAAQTREGVTPAAVDIWADADRLPVPDDSEDFVLSSHVVEHLPNLAAALLEWNRVVRAGGFVFLIVPLPDALPQDRGRAVTTLDHLIEDYRLARTVETHSTDGVPGGRRGHYHVFTSDLLVQAVDWLRSQGLCDWELVAREDRDSKVGNGFTLAYHVVRKAAGAAAPPANPPTSVAVVGRFDRDSYGEGLYPEVLRRAVGASAPDLRLSLYSGGVGRWSMDQSPVRSVGDWERADVHAAALAVGGGDIVRFDRIAGLECPPGWPSPFAPLFAVPAVVGAERGIPVVWNAPGIPNSLTAAPAEIVRRVVGLLDYASVPDESSLCRLRSAGAEAALVPDSVFCLARVVPRAELEARLPALRARLGIDGPHMVAHLSPAGADPARFPAAAEAVAHAAAALGVQAVLLPLSPSYGERDLAERVAARAPGRLRAAWERLHPLDAAALIAGGRAFVGGGLHGSITAFAYGVPSATIDVRNSTKLRRFAGLTGRPVLPVGMVDGERLSEALRACPPAEAESARRERLSAAVTGHFERIAEAIRGPRRAGTADLAALKRAIADYKAHGVPEPSPPPRPTAGQIVRRELLRVVDRWRTGAGMIRRVGDAVGRSLGPARRRTPARAARPTPVVLSEPGPLISVLTPVYNTDPRWLRAAIDSVRRQTYAHWELCLADDGSTRPEVRGILHEAAAADPRLKVRFCDRNRGIAAATNAALELARGEFVAFVDHDDEIEPDALEAAARRFLAEPGLDIVYSDEDKLDTAGRRVEPFRKTGFNVDLLLACNYICHLTVCRRSLPTQLGGLRPAFDGSQDYDLLLRLCERARGIGHIPRVLYHWRMSETSAAGSSTAKPYAYAAGHRALLEAFRRRGEPAADLTMVSAGFYRARFNPPADAPSIIVTPAAGRRLPRGTAAVLEHARQSAAEVIVARRGRNAAAAGTRGGQLVFLGPGAVVANSEWLNVLMGHAGRPGVGAVTTTVRGADGEVVEAGVTFDHNGPAPVGGRAVGHARRVLYDMARTVASAGSTCFLVPRAVFDRLGGFDEALGDEAAVFDFCLRLAAENLRVVYSPSNAVRRRLPFSRPSAADVARLRTRWAEVLDRGDALFPATQWDRLY